MAHMLGVYTIVERKSEEHPDRKNIWIHIGVHRCIPNPNVDNSVDKTT